MRRPFLAVVLLLLAGVCPAQRRDGTYKPTGGPAVPWSINEHQTLIWGGQPYMPIGVRIDPTVQAVNAAHAAGITDVIVDLPANGIGWDPVFAALNQAKMRFLIRVDSLAPMAKGFVVEPQSYRVTGITKAREVKLDLQGASSAFVALVIKSDGTLVNNERVPIVNGELTYSAKPGPEIEHLLLIYPEMTSIEQPDYWEDLDSERDELLGSLRKHPPGPGLRGIVNPMGRGLALNGVEPRFVPTSHYYHMELRQFLEEKYKNVETAMRNWAISSMQLDEKKRSLVTFDTLATLVPLWTTSRGLSSLLNPETNTLYSCDNKRSQAWADISQVINAAGERRFSRFVPDIRSVIDVPVIQDWIGWSATYETSTPVIDGVGMRVSGTTQSTLGESGSRATSSILRWSTHGWLVATDLDLGTGTDVIRQVPSVLDELASMGAKGVFTRTDSPAIIKAIAGESQQRSSDTSQMNRSPLPVFFPENAYNPATPQQLPGDHWWLPCPSDGNRIDLGSKFFAYRSGLNDGTLALWTRSPGRYRLKMTNPRGVRFQTLDGSDPMPRIEKGGIELTLTEFPLLIMGTMEVPIPEVATIETVTRFKSMLDFAHAAHRDVDQEELFFREALNGYDRNPGGTFDQLRKQYAKLAEKISTYSWVEAERTADTNFSEIIHNPGCSGGASLSLRTLVPPGPGGYYSEYNITVKSKDDQEIWIAAKIPAERRGDLFVTIGGQQLRISGDPISLYGGGYGWYKLGTTRIAGHSTKLRIEVGTPSNTEISIDTILLYPGQFKPNGVTPPDPLPFRAIEVKPQKPSKRKGSGGA